MGIFTIIGIGIALLAGGASYVQAKQAQKKAKKLANSMAGVLLNKESNIEPLPVIYGSRRVGGVRVFVETSGPNNEYLYMALALCEGEVGSIAGIEIDGVSRFDSRFAGLVAFQAHTGADDQSVSSLLIGAPSWTTNHRLRGVAYLSVRLKWDQDAFSGIPEITALVTGKRVYDPRTGNTTWSSNPALCIRDYLTNTRYGKGLPASAIDDDAFSDAADDCDNFTVTPYSGATSNIDLFQCNAVIDTGEEIFRNVEKMLLGCRGFLPYTNGKYALYIDQSKTHTLDLTLDNIIGGITFAGEKKEDKFNRVIVKFPNPSTKWQEDAAIWPDAGSTEESTYLGEDNNVLLVDEVEMETVTNYYSARDFARIFLLRSRNGIRVSLQATSEAINLVVGDVVRLTHPTPSFTNKPFQVEQVTLNYDGTVNLDLLEYDSTIYTYDTAAEETDYPDTDLPDPFTVAAPTGLTLTESTRTEGDGTIIPSVLVEWTAADDLFVNSYEVQYKLDTATTYKSLITGATEFDLTLPESGADYDIRVRSINSAGVRSSFVTDQVSIVGDNVAPGTPTNGSVGSDTHLLVLTWDNPSDSDFLYTEIKRSNDATEGNATSIAKISGESFSDGPFAVGTTRYYWLRAVDRSGNASGWVSAGSGTTVALSAGDLTGDLVNTSIYRGIVTNDALAPSNAEFSSVAGRNPREHDIAITVDTTASPDAYYAWEYDGNSWDSVPNLISGNLVVDGSITADKITVDNLAAINSDLGTLTAGSIDASVVTVTNLSASNINTGSLAADYIDVSGVISAGSILTDSATIGNDIQIGSGESVFKADSNGIYLGNETFADAEFRVTPAGALTATSATISGAITATSLTLDSSVSIGAGNLSYDTVTLTNVDGELKINDEGVDTAQIKNNAVDITKIADTLQSTNYSAGSAGWKLTTDGTFEAGNGTFRGALTATSLTLEGTSISESQLASGVQDSLGLADSALQIGDIAEIISEGNIPTGQLTFNDTGSKTVSYDGNDISVTGGSDNTWDTQVYSSEHYASPCVLQFETTFNSTYRFMMGLNEDPTTNASFASIDYAWYLNTSTARIYENGSQAAPDGGAFSYSIGDKFSIVYDGDNVYYYHNDTLKRTVTGVGAKDFYLDSSLYDTPLTINDVRFAPISRIDYGSIGGVTITPGKLYQGAGTFQGSTTGFYLDSSGQFSLTDKLSFDGTELFVDGNIDVSDYVRAGTGSNTAIISGRDADEYAFWAGAGFETDGGPSGGNAPFRVTRDGKVIMTNFALYSEAGTKLFDSQDGLLALPQTAVAQASGSLVPQVSEELTSGTDTFTVTLSSTQTITANFAYPVGALYYSGTSLTDAQNNVSSAFAVTLQYSSDSGSTWNTFGSTQNFSKVTSGTPTSSQYLVIANSFTVSIIYGATPTTVYVASLQSNRGAIDEGMTLVGSTSQSLAAGTYLVRMVFAATGGSGTGAPATDKTREIRLTTSGAGFTVSDGTVSDGVGTSATTGWVLQNFVEKTESDNVTINGTLTLGGDLVVNGTTTTINSTTLTVDDKNIVLADGAANAAAADGAGITIDGANAALTYVSASDTLEVNKGFRVADSSDMGFGTAKAGSSVNHTASVDEGIFWHTSNDYGIYRTAGAWTAGNYQQLRLKWATGIEIDGGNAHAKSGVNIINSDLQMAGTTVIDGSRNITSSTITNSNTISSQYFVSYGGQELILAAGESVTQLNGVTGGNPLQAELVYAVAEGGLQVISSPNNWIDGSNSYNDVTWAQRKVASINKSDGQSDFPAQVNVTGHGNSSQWNTAYTYSQVGHLPLAGGTVSGNLTLDNGTSTTLSVKGDDGGLALIRANGDNQGTGAIEVGQSNNYGGGISYNGDGSPAFVSGESSDAITFYRLDAGTRTEVFYYPFNSNDVVFNGGITSSGTSTFSGIRMTNANTALSQGSGNALRITTNSGYVDIGPKNSSYTHFDTDRGKFYFAQEAHFDGQIYNYNAGATDQPYWHAGNDGSGSGLDADLLDGENSSYYLTDNSYLLRRDNRTISPSEDDSGRLRFGFTSWANNNTSPYADFLHMRSYTDASGGADNLLMFKKDGIGMRLWQQTYGSTTAYSSYVDFWHTGNDGSGSGLDADTLDGQHLSRVLNYEGTFGSGTNWDNLVNTSSVMRADEAINGMGGTGAPGNYPYGQVWSSKTTNHRFQLYAAHSASNGDGLRYRTGWTTSMYAWREIWDSGNDGSGSGLDADTVDGLQAASFLRSDAADTAAEKITFSTGIARNNHNVGHLEGSYNNVGANSDKTNPIYTIGSGYNPSLTSVAGMYGIGYAHPNLWGTGKSSGWGMYVVENGTIHTTLSIGGLWSKGSIFSDTQGTLWGASNDGSGSGLDADLLDGQHGSYYARFNDIRSLGAQAFTGGTNPSITTTQLFNEMDSDGAFDSYTSVFKTSWSYAGNYDLTDAGRFTETAGTSWITWTDNASDSARGSYTALAIAPNTGGSAGKVFIYNDQGSGYAPGWREVWTSTSDGSGSGLDADLLDGIQASSFLRSDATDYLNGTIYFQGDFVGSGDGYRDHGVYGNYNSYRIHHMWSMGTAYRINANGTDFGNLYGFAYTYNNRVYTSNVMAGDHQIVWCIGGTPKAALGANIWTAGNVTAYSDRAVKTNLEVIPDALSKVCQINGYTYDRTDFKPDPETGETPNTRQAGVVAQEVEKVLPEVVSGEEGGKAVAYGNMVSLLIEAIKELKAEVDDLKAQLEEVK